MTSQCRRPSTAVVAAALMLLSCSSSSETDTAPPAAPTGLSAVPGDAQVTLFWNQNGEADLAGYFLSQGASEQTLARLGTTPLTGTSRTVTGLTNGTAYLFALEAVDKAGNVSPRTEPVAAVPAVPDTTPPTIVSSTPGSGATEVAADTPVALVFSEAMDASTVTVALEPSADLGTASWASATQVGFQLPARLAYDTSYALAVAGKDLAGNAMTDMLYFQTAVPPAPPTVLTASPASGATVPVATNVAFTFSHAMDHPSVEGAFSAAPPITCTAWLWSDDSRLATCSHADFPAATSYTLTLGTGARSGAGVAMAAPFNSAFTTAAGPNPPPTIVSTVPASGATAVAPSTTIKVTFSEPVDKASAQAAFFISAPPNHNGNDFAWSADGMTMTFTPSTPFTFGDQVTWRISTALEELGGVPLAAQFDASFKVVQKLTRTLTAVPVLDGTVLSDGTFSTASSSLYVGDTALNVFQRAFLSFDLSVLPANLTRITAATLYLNRTGSNGDVSTLGALRAESVAYGATLEAADFETPILKTLQCPPCALPHCFCLITARVPLDEVRTLTDNAGVYSATALAKVDDDWTNRTARSSRSQYRLRFESNTNVNGIADLLRFNSGNAADATVRPRLVLTYEYP